MLSTDPGTYQTEESSALLCRQRSKVSWLSPVLYRSWQHAVTGPKLAAMEHIRPPETDEYRKHLNNHPGQLLGRQVYGQRKGLFIRKYVEKTSQNTTTLGFKWNGAITLSVND